MSSRRRSGAPVSAERDAEPAEGGPTRANGTPVMPGTPGAPVTPGTPGAAGRPGAPGAPGAEAPRSRRFPSVTRDTARPEGSGRAVPGAVSTPARQWPMLSVLTATAAGLLATAL